MPNQKTLALLDKANHALFIAEQAIRTEEKADVNHPMYLMRFQLAELTRRYVANQPVCDWVCLTNKIV